MDEINSSLESDQVFAETSTAYDFYELEEKWKKTHMKKDHPIKQYIHKITADDYKKKQSPNKD